MAPLEKLTRADYIRACFSRDGERFVSAETPALLFRDIARRLAGQGVAANESVHAFWIPGRIEVLGKHTDYAGGISLTAASERGIALGAAHSAPGTPLQVLDARSGERVVIQPADPSRTPAYPWGVYVQTVVKRIAANFNRFPSGVTLCFSSSLPQAAGMSSSSSLITALFLALSRMMRLEDTPAYRTAISTPLHLADYLGHVENGRSYKGLHGSEGVGTFGGSQDHTAILCSRVGYVRSFGFRPTRFVEEVAVPDSYRFCIANSGVRAEKGSGAKAAYNRLSLEVQRLVSCLEDRYDSASGSLAALTEAAGMDRGGIEEALRHCNESEGLLERWRQFYEECYELIPGFIEAQRQGDMDRCGRCAERSQHLAETSLLNQVGETKALVRVAKSLGAKASSAFGAGFGGSVWALVEVEQVASFIASWRKRYEELFGWHDEADFFVDETGPPAFELE